MSGIADIPATDADRQQMAERVADCIGLEKWSIARREFVDDVMTAYDRAQTTIADSMFIGALERAYENACDLPSNEAGLRAVVAHLRSRGHRLVPEGGRVLTAEQIGDLRELLDATVAGDREEFPRLNALFDAEPDRLVSEGSKEIPEFADVVVAAYPRATLNLEFDGKQMRFDRVNEKGIDIRRTPLSGGGERVVIGFTRAGMGQ